MNSLDGGSPPIPLIERMVSGMVHDLMEEIRGRQEYTEDPDRENRLAEVYVILLGLRYAIEKRHLPLLAESTRKFLESVNPDRN